MRFPHSFFLVPALAGFLASTTPCQEDAAPKPRPKVDRNTKLADACRMMTRLENVQFQTEHIATHKTSAFPVRGAGKSKFRKVSSKGVWSRMFLHLDIDDTDKLIYRGRQMIAANQDEEWSIRHQKLANGKDLAFALDPQRLFSTLASLKLKVVHHEVGDVDGRPCETYTVRLKGDDARTLFWSGSLPEDSPVAKGGAANVMVMRAIGGIGGMANQRPNITVDLAISFDPGTKQVRRVKGRSFRKGGAGNGIGGRILVNGVNFGQGGNDDDDDEEDEEEGKKPKAGTYVQGLPVPAKSALKNATVVEFTYNFTAHNQAKLPKLSASAKKLLGIGQ